MSVIKSITTVGAMTLLSRVFGFVRDVAMAAVLGAGGLADMFFVAFKLPNLFRRLFAEGAFNLAFVPLFAEKLEKGGRDEALSFARHSLSALVLVLLVLVAAFEIIMPLVISAFAPGFLDEPERFATTVELARITFPYLLFISLVSLLSGVLNTVGRFWAAAAAPVLLNITLIAAVLVAAPYFATPAHALAWGVFWAGVLQLGWLVFHARRAGWVISLTKPVFSEGVKKLLGRIAPVAVGAGIYQLNLLIDTIIASTLMAGSISYLFYADRLHQLPVGVIGVAVGTALLPLLSRQISSGDAAAAMHSQNRALEFALLLTLPAAAALIVVPGEIIHVLFERGAFSADATQKTADALRVFAIGLPAYVMVKALAPGFFARGDTVTPIKIGAFCVGLNLVVALSLVGSLAHVGLAAATATASWANALLLAGVLSRRGHFYLDKRMLKRLPRQMLATILMALGVYWLALVLDPVAASGTGAKVLALGVVVAGGALVYAVLAMALGAATPAELKSLRKDGAQTPPQA